MKYEPSLFYSAFDQIDDSIRGKSQDQANENLMGLLAELVIDDEILSFAATNATGFGEFVKKETSRRGQEDVIGSMFGGRVAEDPLKRWLPTAREDFSYMAYMWLIGFLTHLLIKESLGFSWDEITKESFEFMQKEVKAKSFAQSVRDKGTLDIAKTKATHALFDQTGRPRPMNKPMLSKSQNGMVMLGAFMFIFGFETAALVEMREPN